MTGAPPGQKVRLRRKEIRGKDSMEKIILASASPRRAELLRQAGFDFEVSVAEIDEATDKTLPEEIVSDLSMGKAIAVWKKSGERANGRMILAADTVVSIDGKVLGKPLDEENAVRMLLMLSGREHQVYTGVTVLVPVDENEMRHFTFWERTDVAFYPVEEEVIRRYVATGEPMDKAGSYAIQGKWASYVKGIRGDYSNVVGLPLSRLVYEARLHGLIFSGV